MANIPARWMHLECRRASELNLVREEARFGRLKLPALNPFIPQGLQRGSLVEVSGLKCSGRTSTSLYVLAECLSRHEVCAYIDLQNQFDPASFGKTGIKLDRLSWINCQANIQSALRSADLLLHAGGFGIVLLDLGGASPKELNRIPLSYWFRFQRAVENTPTILLICSEHSLARSCTSLSLQIQAQKVHWAGEQPFSLLERLECTLAPRRPEHAKVTSIRAEALSIRMPRIETAEV